MLRRSALGFTLVELLVVLLIVAIITLVAVLSFHNFGRERRMKILSQQTQQIICAAQDRAVLQPAILGLVTTKNGYRFYRYWEHGRENTRQWLPLSEDTLSHPNAFSGIEKWHITGTNTKFLDKEAAVRPIIIFFPDGEVSPFTITLMNKHEEKIVGCRDPEGLN